MIFLTISANALASISAATARSVDVREGIALDRINGPYDSLGHSIDVRAINSVDIPGRYNIPNVGIHLWRLQDYGLAQVTAALCLREFQGDDVMRRFLKSSVPDYRQSAGQYFVRFAGQRAQIKVRVPMAGRKNFVGIIGEVKDGAVQLDVDGSLVAIELSNVDKARLVPVF